ncbi:MAG TPA: glycosyltransferase [Adhaeribacter sp.]|nr:glycosyltransferase [Adhaeribacter sp.]
MVLLTFLVIFYSVLIAVAVLGWLKLKETRLPDNYCPQNRLSVLIPVRNEALNITNLLSDLAAQHYPKQLMEVLVIDDDSEDETAQLVQDHARNSELNIRLLSLENGRGKGKKSAIGLGLEQATGQLIVQTDGDCRVKPCWLALLEHQYQSTGAKFISGPVCLQDNDRFFGKLQVVEFASLIGTGAAAIAMGKPNMCNGANLAYEKAAFYHVGGFSGNEHLASGDDEFLMHKIWKQFPGKVSFLKNSGATVFTPAAATVRQFLGQRVRWASKWRFYKNVAPQLVALLVFSVNAGLLIGLGAWLAGKTGTIHFWILWLAKSGIDFVFLGLVLRFFRRTRFLFYSLPLQLVYAPYVVYCALAGLTGNYRWKGRNLKNP